MMVFRFRFVPPELYTPVPDALLGVTFSVTVQLRSELCEVPPPVLEDKLPPDE